MKPTAKQIADNICEEIRNELDHEYHSPGSGAWGDISDQIEKAIEEAAKPNMTEQKAREILADVIQEDGELKSTGYEYQTCIERYIHYRWINENTVSLEGYGFTADQLEAIAWWMKNMTKYKFESSQIAPSVS